MNALTTKQPKAMIYILMLSIGVYVVGCECTQCPEQIHENQMVESSHSDVAELPSAGADQSHDVSAKGDNSINTAIADSDKMAEIRRLEKLRMHYMSMLQEVEYKLQLANENQQLAENEKLAKERALESLAISDPKRPTAAREVAEATERYFDTVRAVSDTYSQYEKVSAMLRDTLQKMTEACQGADSNVRTE
ncbi:hypothetical protein HED60_01435 [Planctomycetales bacterium ZRK34]|nr:hypothetical protein HED60_01435 [Planctomycetales bacterium ZRK34]